MNALLAYMLVAALATPASPAGGSTTLERRFSQAQGQFEAAQAQMARSPGDSVETRRLFREAAESFASIAADGAASANVYVNTANACHFAGDEPGALLWYLRASQLASTPEIRSAVATLRRVCKAELWPPSRPSIGRVLMFWHYDLGRRVKQSVLLGLYPLGCVLLIAGIFRSRRKRWFQAGLILMVLGGLMGVSDAVATLARAEQWAVVLSPTKGYAGDGRMYSVVVDAIVPGQEVKIVESRPEWLQVELPSAARCWVSRDTCEPVALSR